MLARDRNAAPCEDRDPADIGRTDLVQRTRQVWTCGGGRACREARHRARRRWCASSGEWSYGRSEMARGDYRLDWPAGRAVPEYFRRWTQTSRLEWPGDIPLAELPVRHPMERAGEFGLASGALESREPNAQDLRPPLADAARVRNRRVLARLTAYRAAFARSSGNRCLPCGEHASHRELDHGTPGGPVWTFGRCLIPR